MDDDPKAVLKQNYDRLANEPATWLYVADNLALAARILKSHSSPDLTKESDDDRAVMSAQLAGPMLMLRGCGLECLLKALYVARGHKLGEDGRYVTPGGKHHDLVGLARKASFEMSPADQALLAYVGEFIVQGRYPMMQKAPESHRTLADGSRRLTKWSEQDERDYHSLLTRLSAEAISAAKKRRRRRTRS